MESIEGNNNQAGLFRQGEVLGASKLNYLGQLAGYGTTKHSAGAETIQGPFGTVYMGGNDNGEVTGAVDFPYKVTVESGKNKGEFKVYVRAGTVNSMPSTIDGTYLDGEPRPYLDLKDGDKIKYVVLRCETEGGVFFPRTTDVFLADEFDEFENTESKGYLLLASLALDKEDSFNQTGPMTVAAIYQYIYSSQGLIRINQSNDSPCIWSWTSR